MAKKAITVDADPLRPTISDAQWVAQGWAATSEDLTAAPRLEVAISIRLDPESASLVGRAARLTGRTRSEFVRRATIAAAEEAVKDAEQLSLVVTKVSTDQRRATTGSAHPAKREKMVTTGQATRSTITVG